MQDNSHHYPPHSPYTYTRCPLCDKLQNVVPTFFELIPLTERKTTWITSLACLEAAGWHFLDNTGTHTCLKVLKYNASCISGNVDVNNKICYRIYGMKGIHLGLMVLVIIFINTQRAKQNGCHLEGTILKCIFWNVIFLFIFHWNSINNNVPMIQAMALHLTGTKPSPVLLLSMYGVLQHDMVSQYPHKVPQWVNPA